MRMTEGTPGKVLLFFALPMILGNLLQQLYNMVDTIIVGKFVGEDALAAVGASYALTAVFIMFAIGGGTGASVIISQYVGAKQFRQMKTAISTALITFLGISILLAGIGLFGNQAILTALNTPENILADAVLYLGIYFIGLPFLFMYNILASVFHALGDSKTPLYLLVFSSLLNVGLDLVAVLDFQMGVAGVALATVFAQGVSAVISFFLLLRRLRKYGTDPVYESDGKEEGQARSGIRVWYDTAMLSSMVKVAVPSIIQQSIVSIGMLLVQSVVNGFGSSILAGYTAGTRVESICIIPMIAMGNAMSTFTAQNMGAEKVARVKEGYKAAYGIVGAFAVFIAIVLTVFHTQIISMFLDAESGQAAMQTGVGYLSFIAFFFIFIGMKAITDGVLRGSGDVLVFTLANLVNLTIRVVVAFRFAPIWGVQAVWYAIPMGWTVNYLISLVRYMPGQWQRKRLN